jgi:hypothetical protein
MLQVFDRVISSRSNETLVMLTLAAGGALAIVMALLDLLRARLLAAAGVAMDALLGPRVLDGLLTDATRWAARNTSMDCATSPRCAASSPATASSRSSMRRGCRSMSPSPSSSTRCSAPSRWQVQ